MLSGEDCNAPAYRAATLVPLKKPGNPKHKSICFSSNAKRVEVPPHGKALTVYFQGIFAIRRRIIRI
jgi:hypothetical protein